jgi:plastocyanin
MKRLMLIMLAACGGDDGGTNTMIDAMGSASNKVVEVTCPGAVDGMVTVNATGDAYVPKTQTVPPNAVVKFMITPGHDVTPNPQTTTDPGLKVPLGATKCLKFTTAGSYGFFCTPHGFSGTITVQ